MKNNNQSKRVSSLPFTPSASGGAAINRFKLFLLGILGVSLAAPLAGSVHRLAPSVDARVYYIMNKKERFPVIGAGADSKVKALLPDKQTKMMKYDYISWIEKSLPPVGRITVCDSNGQSTGIQNSVSSLISTYFTFDVVADRNLTDCYVVLTIQLDNANDAEHVAFGELGDLPKGQLVKREVFFPNMIPNGGGQYKFEFYSSGMPIEQFRLERVAGMPQSTSLRIPWDIRLERYLEIARKNKSTNVPLPIFKGFREFDAQSVKNRGINNLKFVVVVKVDGTLELDKGDPQLTDTELTILSKDLQNWQFLPAIKNGKPYEMKVSLPVRL